jgi:hypothetical protein
MLRILALASVLAGFAGCVDFDEPHRVLISDTATTVAEQATSAVYVDLLDFAAATHLSGTAESFIVSGTVKNPWNATTASVTGSGSKVGDVLDVHLAVAVAGWNDELWDTLVDGTVELDQHATYSDQDLPPGTADTEITAHLHMTSSLAGTHDIAIIACNRWIGDDPLYGYHGVVDGDPVSDHYEGNDPVCNVTSP